MRAREVLAFPSRDRCRELIARTVFWKFRFAPLRSVPRAMLSCFDGTHAVVPSGEITSAPR